MPDGSVADGSSLDSASPTLASWCAATGSNYANLSCTGSTEGDVCPGSLFCDSCGQSVPVTCTCESDPTLTFAFHCSDPCAGCAALTDGGTPTDGATPTDAHAVEDSGAPLTSCVAASGGAIICAWLAEDPPTASGVSAISSLCDSQTSSDPPAYLAPECPRGDILGFCAVDLEGHAVDIYYYAPATASDAQAACESYGTWIGV